METNSISDISSHIKGFDFNSCWSGAAQYDITGQLNDTLKKLDNVKEQLTEFDSALELLEEYKALEILIEDLESRLMVYDEEKKEYVEDSYIATQLSNARMKKDDIKKQIITILSSFGVEAVAAVDAVSIGGITIGEVPLIFQNDGDYASTPYSGTRSDGAQRTIATAGCGLTSMAMVESYITGENVTPLDVMNRSGYNGDTTNGGTSWHFFGMYSEQIGINLEEEIYYSVESDFDEVVSYLEQGYVVIGNARERSIFTDGGHYVVLTGVTEDNRITVNDPNKYNYPEYNQYCNQTLVDGFENGFNRDEFTTGKFMKFWVFNPNQDAENSEDNNE